MHAPGQTRSAHRRNYLLQTPDTFVRTSIPSITRGSAIVHIAPAAGAGFAQYTAELDPGGTLTPTPHQRLVFVLEGSAELVSTAESRALTPGGYIFLPAAAPHPIAASAPARLAVIEKPYRPLASSPAPRLILGDESALPSAPLLGDPNLQVRQLLPADPAFDFAVNTMTYQPGAALSQVELHVMEHGLLMLEGSGIYRLGDDWHTVRAGDFIWMAPFCPQWFTALGPGPAKYLIYKDVNRDPL